MVVVAVVIAAAVVKSRDLKAVLNELHYYLLTNQIFVLQVHITAMPCVSKTTSDGRQVCCLKIPDSLMLCLQMLETLSLVTSQNNGHDVMVYPQIYPPSVMSSYLTSEVQLLEIQTNIRSTAHLRKPVTGNAHLTIVSRVVCHSVIKL